MFGGNINGTLDGNILKLEIDLSKDLGPSKSGKTILVASTYGNKPVPGKESVMIGINCYKNR